MLNFEETVKETISKVMHEPVNRLERNTVLADVGVDSLDIIEIIMEIEEISGIKISDDKLGLYDSIDKLIKMCESL